MALNKAEKTFVKEALDANAPITFIAQHLWITRNLRFEPDLSALNKIADEVQDYLNDVGRSGG